MLILTRRPGETIRIGDTTTIEVIEFQGSSKVRIGIDAPGQDILRGEIYNNSEQRDRRSAAALEQQSRCRKAKADLAQEIADRCVHVLNLQTNVDTLKEVIRVSLPVDRVELHAEMTAAGKNAHPDDTDEQILHRLRRALQMDGSEYSFSDVLTAATVAVKQLNRTKAGQSAN